MMWSVAVYNTYCIHMYYKIRMEAISSRVQYLLFIYKWILHKKSNLEKAFYEQNMPFQLSNSEYVHFFEV